MLRLLGLLALVAGIVWLVRGVLGSSGAGGSDGGRGFSVDFQHGQVVRVKGIAPRNVYNAFEDIAARAGTDGRVVVDADGVVAFSGDVSETVRQQFRNAYHAGRMP